MPTQQVRNPEQIQLPDADMSMNSHKIISLANGTAATDAAAYGQLLKFVPFGVYLGISPFTTTAYPYSASIDRSMTFAKYTNTFSVQTTNNISNYWKIEIYRWSDNSLIVSINTSAASANVLAQATTSTFTIGSVSAADLGMYIKLSTVGSPGQIYLAGPLLEITT